MIEANLKNVIEEIKSNIKQVSINRTDENRVMKEMLNDSNFTIGIYDKSGYIGQRCPREEAVNFVKNIINGATGLDMKDSLHLAENYEFTKKDASFLLTNMKDFMSIYMDTGRKLNIVQNEKADANIFAREIPSTKKTIPANEGSKETREIVTNAYTKISCSSRCPKYIDKK